MAILVLMEKAVETEAEVSYRFGFEKPLTGLVQIAERQERPPSLKVRSGRVHAPHAA